MSGRGPSRNSEGLLHWSALPRLPLPLAAKSRRPFGDDFPPSVILAYHLPYYAVASAQLRRCCGPD
jgi:hypothetical protein